MKGETKQWLEKAREDFEAGKTTLKIGKYPITAFLAQQAIEKALKALQIERNGRFDRTHDLHFLGKKLNIPENLLRICEEITTYYVETRYPDAAAKFNEDKVSAALEKAEKVIGWIEKNLSKN